MTRAERRAAKRKLKAKREKNAAKQRKLRKVRAKDGKCRSCPNPVAPNSRTGKPSRSCDGCLEKDAERKRVYALPWQSEEARARRKFELELQLDDI